MKKINLLHNRLIKINFNRTQNIFNLFNNYLLCYLIHDKKILINLHYLKNLLIFFL